MKGQILAVFLGLATFAGCATVQGPVVDRQAINEETKRLEVKALEYNIGLLENVNTIGYRLVRTIPEDEIKVKPRYDIGLFVLPCNKATNRYFGKKPKKGLYVAFVLEGTPMARADVTPGDCLIGINTMEVNSAKDVVVVLDKIFKKAGDEEVPAVTLHLAKEDGQELKTVSVDAEKLPVNVSFAIVEDELVNAGASDKQVVVTKGLLNFTKSDEELAGAIAHELAHVIRGHFSKKKGGIIVNTIAAVSLGITAEVFVPGMGSAVMNGVQGVGGMFNLKFSRDLEREADFYSLKILDWAGYSLDEAAQFQERFSIEIPKTLIAGYLNTHPNSPERKLRIEKSIEEIQQEK
jgi:Zn-dependent protease with chaperone function